MIFESARKMTAKEQIAFDLGYAKALAVEKNRHDRTRRREKMRSVNKTTMDELARLVRKYWATGDTDILAAKYRKASELSKQAFGSDIKWIQFCDMLDGVICFNKNVSNETIYKILGLLCIEVSAPAEAGDDAD